MSTFTHTHTGLTARLHRWLGIAAGLASLCLSSSPLAETRASAPHIDVALHHSQDSFAPGTSGYIGLQFKPEPGWHIYWKNPGDTGLEPRLNWTLAEGVTIEDIAWPYPERIPVAHLTNLGYHEEVMLAARYHIDDDVDAQHLNFSVQADWLVCEESCVPGSAQLSIQLPRATDTTDLSPVLDEPFASWQAALPQPMPVLAAKAHARQGQLEIELFAQSLLFQQAEQVEVFLEEKDVVTYDAPEFIAWAKNRLVWRQPLSPYLGTLPPKVRAVIVIDERRAYHIDIPVTSAS